MVTTAFLLGSLILSAIFGVAGVAKIADRKGTYQSALDFGLPPRLAKPVSAIIPVAEIVLATLLLFQASVLVGAIGALALLLLFSLAIARSLAIGSAPQCRCFGQLDSAPTSWKTLVRNGVLALLAGFVISVAKADPDVGVTEWIWHLEASHLVALSVVVVAGAIVTTGVLAFLKLMESYGKVLVRLEQLERVLAVNGFEIGSNVESGLPPGTSAPKFTITDPDGADLSLDRLLADALPVLLVFTSARCEPCKEFVPVAARWQKEHAKELTLAFVIEGTAEEVQAEVRAYGIERVAHDPKGVVYEEYKANGTPSGVLIAPNGVIASWMASGRQAIEALVSGIVTSTPRESPHALPLGTRAPELVLSSLDGGQLSLASLAGRTTLLLFWNSGCGFCQQMREQLRAWQATATVESPALVIIASGEMDAVRAEEFRSQVVLDPKFSVGKAFGAVGTPSSVLLDADGRVASNISVGAKAFFALASHSNTDQDSFAPAATQRLA